MNSLADDSGLPIGSRFVTKRGETTKGEYAVFPICQWIDKGKNILKFVSTAFFISNNGLFLTAKHSLLNGYGKRLPNLFSIHFKEHEQYYVRNLAQVVPHPIADIAAGNLKVMTHNVTKDILKNKCVSLDPSICKTGEKVCTFAYPQTQIIDTKYNQTHAHFNTNFEVGHITEVLLCGRDKVLLPGACYRTDMKIAFGASGGPVINLDGNVIGINSTGWDGTPDSYVTMISPFFDLEFEDVSIPDHGTKSRTLREMVRLGLIAVA